MPEPDPNVRLSNAEREALIARLQAATEEGRLDLDEFAERSREVYEAKTYAEVERLLTDLPAEDRALAVPNRAKVGGGAPDLELNPSHSHVKRQGEWRVPARIKAKAAHSAITLDCRTAVFTAADIDLDVDLRHSKITLILPPNASAIDEGVDLHGGAVVNRCHSASGGPRFHISGKNAWSKVVVRRERRFLWWRW